MDEPVIRVDIKDFKRSATKFMRNDYPEAIAMFTKILAGEVETVERKGLAQDLNLMSNWIQKRINAFPRTPGQVSKIKKDVRVKNRFTASVMGHRQIAFMTGHNDSAIRTTQANWRFGTSTINGKLAIPGKDLDKDYRTKTGRVKQKYYPTKLLKDWTGKRGRRRRRGNPKAFLIKGRGGMEMIMRRTNKSNPKHLDLLWIFKERAKIKKDWSFDERGEKAVKHNYERAMQQAWKRLK